MPALWIACHHATVPREAPKQWGTGREPTDHLPWQLPPCRPTNRPQRCATADRNGQRDRSPRRGTGYGHRATCIQMRCECGRSWFELELLKFVECPACHKLSLVSHITVPSQGSSEGTLLLLRAPFVDRLSKSSGGLRLFPTLFEITLIGTAIQGEYLTKKMTRTTCHHCQHITSLQLREEFRRTAGGHTEADGKTSFAAPAEIAGTSATGAAARMAAAGADRQGL